MVTSSDNTRAGSPAGLVLLVSAVILCSAGALVFFLFDPTRVSIFPPCVFHQVSGLDCPGCGAQRALHQLLHGNLVAALRLNALFVLSLPLAAWYGPRLISRAMAGKTTGNVPRWFWFYLAAWVIFGLVRNLPFPVCQWFAA
jgi:hypothetical protein